jgi:DNA-binding NtrC family response regulator
VSDEQQRNIPPARDPQATTGPGLPDIAPPGNADPARILILEDTAWDAELAQRLLTNAGFSFSAVVVETRASFVEQLAVFRPDVIIADYALPGFSGTDALQIVQEQCPEIPFICWSGVLGDEAAVELIKQGATDYILKDRPARLPSAVDRALTESRQRARLAQIEGQLGQAQRLASLGHLGGAEQALNRTRQMLASIQGEAAVPDPPRSG